MRNLQTQSAKITISGQNLSYSNTLFVTTSGQLGANEFMMTIDPPTFQPYLQLEFTNCVFNIDGNFLFLDHSIKVTFTSCTFNVAATNTFLKVDYSSIADTSCQTLDGQGNIQFINSVFQDGSTVTNAASLTRNLLNIKSQYDITFSKAQFKNMVLGHRVIFEDYQCSNSLEKAQNLMFSECIFMNTNMKWNFNYNNLKPVQNQLLFTMQLSNFKNLNLTHDFMALSITSESEQNIKILDNVFEQLNVTSVSKILDFNLMKSHVLFSGNTIQHSLMQQFMAIDAASNVWFNSSTTMTNITNNGPTLLTAGLFSITNTLDKTQFYNLKASNSVFNHSPLLYVVYSNEVYLNGTTISNITLQNSDLISVNLPTVLYMNGTSVDQLKTGITDGSSSYQISNIVFKNSQAKLFEVDSYQQTTPSSTKYKFKVQNCAFTSNTYVNFALYSFTKVDTTVIDLENTNCISTSAVTTCASAQYFDTITQTCNQCPKGCASCSDEDTCTSCLAIDMTIKSDTNKCECPAQQYYYDIDTPRCRSCLSKCATCNNEYKCLTYAACQNPFQTLNTDGTCEFKCASGLAEDKNTCQTCSDSNCQICTKNGTTNQHCGLCKEGYFLDLLTYQCVESCPAMSKSIASTKVQGRTETVRYCRPFTQNTLDKYEYFIDPNSTLIFEFGTYDYPFKNMDSPAKEIFNFMYERDTDFTVFHKRGTSMKHYYGIMPIIIVNIKMYNLTTYGDPELAKPYVYITDHEYLWPDSTMVSLAESTYDFNTRVNRGDMDISEATKFFLKFNVFRGSMYIKDIDFQSIMFGDAWSNPLVFTFDAVNQTVTFDNTYLDIDGSVFECYFPMSLMVKNAVFNVTNYEYGIWNDFRWDCYANNAEYARAFLIIQDSLFIEKHQQALYNFIFFASMDDMILRNNTFDGITYLDMETRPFLDVHPQSLCDPQHRTQNIFMDGNTFINLYQSNIIFAVNYMNAFNGTKIFSMQNNRYINSQINTEFISMQILNPSQVTVANNYYQNVTVVKDQKVFFFFSSASNIDIYNETLEGNTLDDLYTIGAANSINVRDFKVNNNSNTGSITETSAILRISTANNLAKIENFRVTNSTFMYGKAIEIEYAASLEFRNAAQTNNKLFNQDFLVFNQINKALIENLSFTLFQKSSDKSRFAISLPTLTLSSLAGSMHELRNITFSQSQSSFLSVSQVSVSQQNNATFNFKISNCTLDSNTLSSKDSLIEYGEINYKYFNVTLDQVNIINNQLELGTIYSLKMNCQQMLIKNSQMLNNSGQFASLEPASSDGENPLMFYLDMTTFRNNYGKADALIQLTTNSKLFTTNSEFVENYSIGRGSIVFADYQNVYALFRNCSIQRNYAYQGGVFYIQYSSEVEVSNCTLIRNFAVTGGVAYVNNDGKINLNNKTKVYNNSALNTCFLFLINTQFESKVDNVEVTQNDQVNSIIPKRDFLSQKTKYQHLEENFFTAMQAISDKVQRTVDEKADSAVYAIKAKINFTNTNIYNNDLFLSASTESTVGIVNSEIGNIKTFDKMMQAVSSSIELTNVKIDNISINDKIDSYDFSSHRISIVNKSFLRISGCTMSNINTNLLYVSGSTLIIEKGSLFKNIMYNVQNVQSIFAIDTTDIQLYDTQFEQLSSKYISPIINLQENTLISNNTSFNDFDKTLFQMDTGKSYTFQNINVTKGRMEYMEGEREFMVNSIVFDGNAVNLTLQNANISGIYTQFSSPVVYIENDATSTSKTLLNITDSYFKNNTATSSAGVIYSLNVDINVNNTIFDNNTALEQDAGALYLECEDAIYDLCTYSIQNSVFQKNTASVNGGAMKFTYFKPNITNNNTFTDNKAQYGNDLASYPVQMLITQNNAVVQRRLDMLSTEETQAMNITDGVVFKIDIPLVSGSLMSQNISLIMLDEMGRSMNTDNNSVAVMSSISSDVQVMKSKSVKAVNGTFTFDDVIIIGPPGQDIILKITSDSIVSNKITKAFPTMVQKKVYIKAFLRLCTRGEYQSSDNKCIICSDGFYTLLSNQTQCQECPENAVCQEGFKIITDAGFWRQNVNTTDIYACYNPESCLSGYEVQCAAGYGGNLCQSCVKVQDDWYSRESANDCSKCISHTANAWRLVGVAVLVVVYFIILIFINIRTAGRQKMTTVYMRILTNYFQILTLAQSYDLSWDDNLKKFLEAISFIAKSSEIILSIDCFVRDSGVETHPIFVKMVIACMFPLIAISLTFIFWSIIKLIRRNIQAFTHLITSVIIVIFISLPPVTSITFSIFNCIEIFNDGDTYLALDMSIQCWQDQHSHYANSFGIPIIVIWVIGLPLVALIILFTRRHQLTEQQNLQRYGFLYVGLNQSAFYWEILLHFRKVLLISINVFFTTFKPLYRALIGFMLMIIYIEFLQKVQPYATPEINDLEFKANIAAFATFYGGLFFISDELPFGVSVLLFVLILFINMIFWYSWFKLTLNNVHGRISKWLQKFLCFKKAKQGVKDDADFSGIEAQPDALHIEDEEVQDSKQKSDAKKGDKRPRGTKKNKTGDKNLDDSSRYALANDDSSRNLEESYRQDASALFITTNMKSKSKVIDKKKKKKEVDDEEMHVDTSEMSLHKNEAKKSVKSSKIKKKSSNDTDHITDSDSGTAGIRKKSTKKSNGKIIKQSSSELDSHTGTKSNKTPSSQDNKADNKNAGDMIDKASSNSTDEKKNHNQADKSEHKSHKGSSKKSKKTKLVQNEDSYIGAGAENSGLNEISVIEMNEDTYVDKKASPKISELQKKPKKAATKIEEIGDDAAVRAFQKNDVVFKEADEDSSDFGIFQAKMHSVKQKINNKKILNSDDDAISAFDVKNKKKNTSPKKDEDKKKKIMQMGIINNPRPRRKDRSESESDDDSDEKSKRKKQKSKSRDRKADRDYDRDKKDSRQKSRSKSNRRAHDFDEDEESDSDRPRSKPRQKSKQRKRSNKRQDDDSSSEEKEKKSRKKQSQKREEKSKDDKKSKSKRNDDDLVKPINKLSISDDSSDSRTPKTSKARKTKSRDREGENSKNRKNDKRNKDSDN
ncbi:UNKNOWN [Stylonychia lemnae]|uniref:Uncharacterized protein n=1 Tax=Stylonychia lemnae TaxID=5949 RepID=A0A078AXA4_STYLE|nr:UNKNOWN [Stylonychia lemnae]|eukprot:CDW85403.1 UNKNOWN [Stylonychia lemnae]